jgi:tetratricopeptide (TPR) repeat protein
MGDRTQAARAAYNFAFVFLVAGTDRVRAGRLLEESLATFRALGDRAAIGRTAWALAQLTGLGADRTRDDLLAAKAYAQEAVEQHTLLDNRFDLGWALHGLGLMELKLGELEAAAAHWRQGMEIFLAADDDSGVAIYFSNFAEIAKARGDIERHDVLVGAWTTISKRTGVGLTALFSNTEAREMADAIPPERQPAVQRGMSMTRDEAVAYTLSTETATAS